MKSIKKLQVAVAAASLFAAAAPSMAASVSQSGLAIAREAISANVASTQTLRAPTVTFNYDNGPAANGNSTQDFNVTLTLGGDGDGKWAAATATYKTVAALRRNNGNAVVPVLPSTAVVPAGAVAIVLQSVDVVPGTNEKTFRYKFRLVNNTASSIGIGDLQMNFNGQNPGDGVGIFLTGAPELAAPVAADGDYQRVKNLQTVVNAVTVDSGAGVTGDTDSTCGEGLRKMTVTTRNYIGPGDGVEGESANSAATITNNGYLQFATALRVQLARDQAVDRNTDPLNGNQKFVVNGVATNDVMALGTVKLSNRNIDAWDVSQQGNYYKLGVNDLDDGNDDKNGDVDVAALRLNLDANNGFVAGAKFRLSRTPECNVGTSWLAATLTNSNKNAAVTFSLAELAAADAFGAAGTSVSDTAGSGVVGSPFNIAVSVTDRAYICMQVPGGALIPQSKFEGTATLLKFTAGGEDADEQANVSCKAPLAGLGGGIKIDVRNYMEFPADGDWRSYVRVINNSETVTADVQAQYIRADGSYGKWVTLGTLAPRAAKFWSDAEIKNLMATAGTLSSAGGANQDFNTGVAASFAGSNARLRISSEAASTLRVQNYVYNRNTNLLTEMSSSQGADFVNVEASQRDHIDQDAQTGIQK